VLSSTSHYALRALGRLAQEPQGRSVLGRNLAREAHVPPQYLSKIMLMLRNAGLVDAARGTRGGYRLLRLHLDAMDRARRLKPRVPLTGNDGIPLRDMWELKKEL